MMGTLRVLAALQHRVAVELELRHVNRVGLLNAWKVERIRKRLMVYVLGF